MRVRPSRRWKPRQLVQWGMQMKVGQVSKADSVFRTRIHIQKPGACCAQDVAPQAIAFDCITPSRAKYTNRQPVSRPLPVAYRKPFRMITLCVVLP